MSPTDRDILFSNEAFVIGMLQAVSGGGLVAGIAQPQSLTNLSGPIAFLVFLTAMGGALLSAVLAAYWKHQYKLWDVKAHVSAGQGADAEARTRSNKASRYLTAMRSAFVVSLVVIVFGTGSLIVAIWFRVLSTP